jgi:hypothetical protein
MSGTAALAAARRRRAGGVNTNANVPITRADIPQPQTQKVSINPLQILQTHDKQLTVLTKNVETLQEKHTTSEDVLFYKEKYNNLLSEMTEMKTNFVKMQTFCMETNMKVESMNTRLTELLNSKVNE